MPHHPRKTASDAPMTRALSPHPPSPGFITGVRALFRGVRYILHTSQIWPYACVPALVLTLLLGAAAGSTARWVFPAIQAALPTGESAAGQALWVGTSGLLALGVFLLGASLAFALTPPLSSPALEHIVTLRERSLAVPERPPLGLLSEIWCGFRAQVFVLIGVLPVLVLLWLVELALPPLAVVTVPLKLVVTSLALAWNLLDYPLTLRGVRMRERYLLFTRFKGACLGFGAAFAVLFWIPCGCQIVLLPVGAAAAAELVWQLLASDPSVLPELPRPPATGSVTALGVAPPAASDPSPT